jgi:hypothetical protein
MVTERQKPVLYGLISLVAVWLLAWTGYSVARHSKVTAQKVATYLRTVDLNRLSPQERARALRDLAAKLNALSSEERRLARLDREWSRWFTTMTDPEKSEFIESTLPTGFKQMLASFEELPEARRRRAIDDALKRLKEARTQLAEQEAAGVNESGANLPPVLSEELRQKVAVLGLKSFYSQSSAQTKAEVAPLLDELQRFMESGAVLRVRPRE